ncbi:hypothetical protein HY620_00940 [Candidatus Uhrbacteria bacterium]|nr:hypothetical protein [Candidatus Uhrbacteria bacterium]
MLISTKIKVGLGIAGLGVLGLMSPVYAGDLNWSADTPISVGGQSLTIRSGSEATNMVVGTSTLTVTVASGDSFTLASSERKAFVTSPNIDGTCTSSENAITVTGANTVVITPQGTVCVRAVAVVGGGGSTPAPAPTAPAPTPTPTTKPAPAPTSTTTSAPAPTQTPAAPVDRAAQLTAILEEAKSISGVSKELPKAIEKGVLTLEEKLSVLEVKPTEVVLKVIEKVVPETVTRATAAVATKFIADGTPTTMQLGAGERAGVVNSYKAAFGSLPTNEAEWQDVVKIANGRFPSQTNAESEKRAELSFKTIYNRAPNRKSPNDDAAVVVMAYGLRTATRNMQSESAAIKSYKAIFKRAPVAATAWDAVRAIAYSGAKR